MNWTDFQYFCFCDKVYLCFVILFLSVEKIVVETKIYITKWHINHNLFNRQKQNSKSKINFVTKTEVLDICPLNANFLFLFFSLNSECLQINLNFYILLFFESLWLFASIFIYLQIFLASNIHPKLLIFHSRKPLKFMTLEEMN